VSTSFYMGTMFREYACQRASQRTRPTTMDGSMGSIGSDSVGRSRRMRLGGRMGHAEEPYDSMVCGPESFNIRSGE